MGYNDDTLKEFIGRTFTEITMNDAKDEIIFTRDDDKQFKMYHSQDCCESVSVEDICGDLADLINTPMLQAEEVSNSGNDSDMSDWPEGVDKPEYTPESYTWTFYKFATIKGSVTIRWYGTSNGYYSESVSLVEVGGDRDW